MSLFRAFSGETYSTRTPAVSRGLAAVAHRHQNLEDLTMGWEQIVRLDNLLNTRYEPVFGYGAPGFCVYAGFQIN